MTAIPDTAIDTIEVVLRPYMPNITKADIAKALDNMFVAPTPTQDKTAMTRKEAAAALQVSLGTINNYIKAGSLKAIKLGPGGRLVRIDSDSVYRLLGIA